MSTNWTLLTSANCVHSQVRGAMGPQISTGKEKGRKSKEITNMSRSQNFPKLVSTVCKNISWQTVWQYYLQFSHFQFGSQLSRDCSAVLQKDAGTFLRLASGTKSRSHEPWLWREARASFLLLLLSGQAERWFQTEREGELMSSMVSRKALVMRKIFWVIPKMPHLL